MVTFSRSQMEDSLKVMTDTNALQSSMLASVLYTKTSVSEIGRVGTKTLPVSRSTSESSWSGCASARIVVTSEGLLTTSIGMDASADSCSRCWTVVSTLRSCSSLEKVTVSPPLGSGIWSQREYEVGTIMGALVISGLFLPLPRPPRALGVSSNVVGCWKAESFLLAVLERDWYLLKGRFFRHDKF